MEGANCLQNHKLIIKISVLAIFLIMFPHCKHKNNEEKNLGISISDIIGKTFEKANDDKLLTYDSIAFKNQNRFKDTFIIEKAGLLLKYTPKFTKIKTQLMTKDQICEILASQNKDFSQTYFDLPVLQLYDLVKTDSSFEITIIKTTAWPTIDSKGNRARRPKGIYDGDEKCEFGFYRSRLWYRLIILNGQYHFKLVEIDYGI